MVTYPAISYSDHQRARDISSDLMMKTIWGRSDMIGLSSQKSLLDVVCFFMTKIRFQLHEGCKLYEEVNSGLYILVNLFFVNCMTGGQISGCEQFEFE